MNNASRVTGQDHEVERALGVALRTLQEWSQILERMLQEEREHGNGASSSSLHDRAAEARENAEPIRSLLLDSS